MSPFYTLLIVLGALWVTPALILVGLWITEHARRALTSWTRRGGGRVEVARMREPLRRPPARVRPATPVHAES